MMEAAEILTTHFMETCLLPRFPRELPRNRLCRPLKGILRYASLLLGHLCLWDTAAELERQHEAHQGKVGLWAEARELECSWAGG